MSQTLSTCNVCVVHCGIQNSISIRVSILTKCLCATGGTRNSLGESGDKRF